MKRSLRKQLLQWVLIPLICISFVTAAIAFSLTDELARQVYDDELLNSADSVISRAEWSHGDVKLNLPKEVLAVMAHDGRDRFYFQLSRHGKPILGYKELPSPELSPAPKYQTLKVNGEELRVLSMLLPKEEEAPNDVMLVVAETRRARMDLVGQIFFTVMIPQLLLIVCGCIAVWLGVGKALRQLENIRRAVSERSPADLQPVDASDAPAEVEPLIDALNRLFAGVSQDLDRQRRFVANAAHQLRTPLAGLGTYCELAMRYAPPGKIKEVITQMQSLVGRMNGLVNQLLSLARCESAVTIARIKRPIDLNTVASMVTAEMVPASIEKQLDLEFEPIAQAASILGDAPSLHEMMKNLIDNAIKYTPKGGKVTVGVQSEPNSVSVYVDDTGPGIPQVEQPRIFERFYRVPDTSIPGTGLGLAIVHDVAQAHQAKVEIVPGASGSGTRFVVRFAPVLAETGEELVIAESLQQKVG